MIDMKTIYSKDNRNILVLARGEEFIDTLICFCKKNNITAATFSAIGACNKTVLSWYDLGSKQYEDHELNEGMEIANITGNIALLDGKYIIHAHGTFARRDLSVIAGHIKKLTVSATCEVRIDALETEFRRAYDGDTGLNLLG